MDAADETIPNGTVLLQHLLNTRVGDTLKLWFTLGFDHAEVDGRNWYGPGGFNGGALSIDVVYGYSGPPLPMPDLGGLVLEP